MAGQGFYEFVTGLSYERLPAAVVRMAERSILDLIGTAAAGSQTDMARIASDHAARYMAAGAATLAARMLFDGRAAGPLGVVFAGGFTIDSFDCHDGHGLTKGHPGCAVLPTLVAMAETLGRELTGKEFLTGHVIGYEVALRAGIALQRTVTDYHSTGSWSAVGAAALAGRLLGLDERRMREAVGIAEYHGPRSQMMRCVDHPTMVRDGAGSGALAGLGAAFLAQDGFTGAPALVVEGDEVKDVWSDLGERWRILDLYFKPHAVCRWAQPAIEAALAVRRAHDFSLDAIETLEIETFSHAARLNHPHPETTEIAQYSLPFSVAAATVHGDLPPFAIIGSALQDPAVLSVSDRVRLAVSAEMDAQFPAKRLARARFRLTDGRVLESETMTPRGDPDSPLSDAEIERKFHLIAERACGGGRAERIVETVAGLKGLPSVAPLLDLVTAVPACGRQRDAA